ncbi:hypothetical protein FRACYDRAFT_254210 [Fragilariopsis cylindrus CCMP1102]|uniref:Uncharacterized protein n=1 Tax=Fragilariopsis cylindrus CCMP1102 TaxID=635003 RepID=A0A1E7ELD7_9STRA|nr:hypothetical protein FRACYDRAFT_254210 [Fragilariopsis cylindrus CCMP1102]|eukprot:OEU06656.1 hypothetical protein FRACYDRAFT_254210 [Fragilariopsis cylindrus CCMP1102]
MGLFAPSSLPSLSPSSAPISIYFDGGNIIGKCEDGNEVSEDECYTAASEVNGSPLSGGQVNTIDPNISGVPCGCWIAFQTAYFRNPTEIEGCAQVQGIQENLVCDSSRTCDSYVAFKPIKRCKKEQPGTGKKVRFYCPGTCKKKCPRGKCENLKTFRFQGNSNACDSYVAEKPVKRCKKDVEGKKDKVTGKLKKVKFFCPATCKKKCKTL